DGTHLENVRFLSEPLQCGDVPCETDDHVKIHGDLVEFAPPHIAYLPAGESAEIEVKVTIPIGQHACDYVGHLLMVADVDGICQAQMSDSVEITVEVLPEADLDIDDNHAEVSENKLRMKGAKLTTATGHFTVVNPNSWDQNVDFEDGPGNIRIDPLNVIKTSLRIVGDPTKAIASSAITVGALPSLGSGESADIEVSIDIPDGLPVNDFYQGTIEVIYDNCLGGGTVSDIVGVELHLLPTQGTLVILEDSVSGEFCPGNPWTMVGQVTHSFEVMANGDHRNIRVASGGLRHGTLDKKLDLFNFYPEEIAFLPAGETRTITVITKIPIGQHSGNYADYFRIVSENGGEDSVHADIDICEVFDLDVLDDYGNVSANVMEIQAIGRANQTGGEWKLRAFDIGIPGEQIANNDGFDGPGNTPIDCIECEFDEWSPLWHEDDHDHHFHSNFTFEGYGTVIGDTCSWMSGEFKRMWVSIFVPPIKGGDNHPGTYKGGLRCHALAAGDTVATDHFDIEVQLARIVGPGNTIQDDGSFGAFPTEEGAVIYWGDFASVGLDGSVTLYRIDNETGEITQVNDAPWSQNSQYVDTTVKEGQSFDYQIEIDAAGKKTALGPISIGGTPRTFFLAQNAPNPVRDQTMIAYQLPKQGRVSLKVYDINGRLVRTIKDTEETVGFYSVTWDGTNNAGRRAANGIYFYRLESPGFSSTKKLTLVR
ncbi:MAG: T9SS type A sorting domain-containing protein, partial [Gemmatimonadetes bacterium]|nr:T9SS type A sorting domain-containing protein [Gemmatimonadota bacterium]